MKHSLIEVTFTHISQPIVHTGLHFSRPDRLWLFILSILLLFLFSHPSLAVGFGKSNMLQPYVGYTFTADDNMIRIRDNPSPLSLQNPQINAAIEKGNFFDTSHRFMGGAIFEKEISRQRLSANFNWAHTSFDKFSSMDNNLKNASGNWNWFWGKNFHGNMGATYMQSLSFLLNSSKNIRTEQTEYINATWRPHSKWRLQGDYTRYNLHSSNPGLRFLNRTEDQFVAKFDYLLPGDNFVGILLRNIRGDFHPPPRFFHDIPDSSYDQKDILARVNWAISEKSNLLIKGGWMERNNTSLTVRDFSGFKGRIIYNWQPTEKLGLTLEGWRETSARQNFTASGSLNTGGNVIPYWNITQKVRLEGDFSYETRNFNKLDKNELDLANPELSIGRHNTFRNAAMKLIYNPYLGLQLIASAYHTDVSSDGPRGGFNANGANINLQYTYGKR